MSKLVMYFAALIAGVFNAVEPGQNASLAKSLGRPWIAALVLLAVNAIVFVIVGFAKDGLHLPTAEQVRHVPWWAWLGGVTSAVIIVAQLFVSEQLGASRFVGVVVTASVVTSLVLDQFGLVGFAKDPVNAWRLIGGALMVVGVTLVSEF